MRERVAGDVRVLQRIDDAVVVGGRAAHRRERVVREARLHDADDAQADLDRLGVAGAQRPPVEVEGGLGVRRERHVARLPGDRLEEVPEDGREGAERAAREGELDHHGRVEVPAHDAGRLDEVDIQEEEIED